MAYSTPIAISTQFRFCGNPFRADMYQGCDFGCKYCFANTRMAGAFAKTDEADMRYIERLFARAFDKAEDTKSMTIELMQHRVPMHVGGMSDPFQTREWDMGLTKQLIELSNHYNYPMIFSTKNASFPTDYWNVLDPRLHAFQVSLMGYDDDFIRYSETNTPTAPERIAFIKELKRRGFWVGIRFQPLIEVDQVLKVINAIGKGVLDYATVEHLKIFVDDLYVRELYQDKLSAYHKPRQGRQFELNRPAKRRNIEAVKAAIDCPVGVGDNDLHELSDSKCCCGVDCIKGGAFANWLQYNYTAFAKGGSKDVWTPKCDATESFIGSEVVAARAGQLVETYDGFEIKPDPSLKAIVDYYCDHLPFITDNAYEQFGLFDAPPAEGKE